MTFEIDISNRQQVVPVDCGAVRAAILQALQMEQVASAVLSVSIVDNPTIHTLNRDHLQHDYPTDVISFQLSFCEDTDSYEDLEDSCPDEADPDAAAESEDGGDVPSELPAAGAAIEGEIVASAEMAASMAAAGRWSAQDELTLYVIHGLLHVCGYDDLSAEEKSIMRRREQAILASLGLTPVYADDTDSERD